MKITTKISECMMQLTNHSKKEDSCAVNMETLVLVMLEVTPVIQGIICVRKKVDTFYFTVLCYLPTYLHIPFTRPIQSQSSTNTFYHLSMAAAIVVWCQTTAPIRSRGRGICPEVTTWSNTSRRSDLLEFQVIWNAALCLLNTNRLAFP